MVVVHAATMEEWHVLRDIRLEALREAPDAFLSTYAEQATSGESDWRRRISRGCTFFAYVSDVSDAEPVGLVGGFLGRPSTVELVSLWVRPKARGQGVGDALVAAVVEWARANNATLVHLWLIEPNEHARALYERCGFSPTNERQPLPTNENRTEVGMTCPL